MLVSNVSTSQNRERALPNASVVVSDGSGSVAAPIVVIVLVVVAIVIKESDR